MFIEVAVEK